MNKQELQEAIGFLYDPEEIIGFELFFVLKVDNRFELRLADLGDDNLPTEVKNGFLEYLNGRTIQNEEAAVKPLSELDSANTTIHYYDLEGIPDGLEVINSPLITDQISIFNFNTDSLTDVKAFLIKLSSVDSQVVLYKNHSHLNLLKQKNGVFFIKDNERFVKPQEGILRFSFTIDFLKVGESLFVYDSKCLQRQFNFNDILVHNAQIKVQELNELGFVDNIEELEEFVSDKSGATKMLKLRRDSPVLQMQFNDVRGFVKNHPFLKRRLKFNEEETQFHLHTKISRTYFIELMNDNYLTSELTKKYYNSSNKDDMKDDEENEN